MNYRHVATLSLGHLVVDLNQGAIPAMLPFLIAAHDLSYAAAAGIVFAANASSTIVQPLFGHAADRISKPWLLPLGLILGALGLALTGIVPSYHLIIFLALLSGIGIAAYHPEAARLINLSAGTQKATAMSFFGVGGTLGFALGPLLITTLLLNWGLNGTLGLAVPAIVMALIVVTQLPGLSTITGTKTGHNSGFVGDLGPDAWGPFVRLTLIVIVRSIIFYGLNTFIPLYWIKVLDESAAAGAIALTTLASAGVVGNLVGGRLADRFGHIKAILVGSCILIPLLPTLLWVSNALVATFLLVPIGLALFAVYSPTIVMGQKYLPNRIGFSSGITLGLAVAIGGVATPFLGMIADHYGIWTALAGLTILPVLAAALTLTLPDHNPVPSSPGRTT
jgi:MFS transporter, FSR family, fosmidomycin resistance protein